MGQCCNSKREDKENFDYTAVPVLFNIRLQRNGLPLRLSYSSNKTIDDLLDWLENDKHLITEPSEYDVLCNGKVLDHDKTLEDHQISQAHILELVSKREVENYINGGDAGDGDSGASLPTNLLKVEEQRARLSSADECNVPEDFQPEQNTEGRIKINIRSTQLSGVSKAFLVNPLATIHSIKGEIANEFGFEISKQILYWNLRILGDRLQIKDLEIPENIAYFTLMVKNADFGKQVNLKIRTQLKNIQIAMNATCDMFVMAIKNKIQDKCEVPIEMQNLLHRGRQLPSTKTMLECGLMNADNNTIILMELEQQKYYSIYVRYKQQTFELMIHPSFNIEIIKDILVSKIRVPIDMQTLSHNGEILENKIRIGGIKETNPTFDLSILP